MTSCHWSGILSQFIPFYGSTKYIRIDAPFLEKTFVSLLTKLLWEISSPTNHNSGEQENLTQAILKFWGRAKIMIQSQCCVGEYSQRYFLHSTVVGMWMEGQLSKGSPKWLLSHLEFLPYSPSVVPGRWQSDSGILPLSLSLFSGLWFYFSHIYILSTA